MVLLLAALLLALGGCAAQYDPLPSNLTVVKWGTLPPWPTIAPFQDPCPSYPTPCPLLRYVCKLVNTSDGVAPDNLRLVRELVSRIYSLGRTETKETTARPSPHASPPAPRACRRCTTRGA